MNFIFEIMHKSYLYKELIAKKQHYVKKSIYMNKNKGYNIKCNSNKF